MPGIPLGPLVTGTQLLITMRTISPKARVATARKTPRSRRTGPIARARADAGAAGAVEGTASKGTISLASPPPEQALGPEEERADQDRIHDRVPIRRRNVSGHQPLGHPDDEAAKDRPRN